MKGSIQGAFSKPSSSQLLSINLAINDLLLSSSSTTKVPLQHQQFTPALRCSRAALSRAAAGPCLCRADPDTRGQGRMSPTRPLLQPGSVPGSTANLLAPSQQSLSMPCFPCLLQPSPEQQARSAHRQQKHKGFLPCFVLRSLLSGPFAFGSRAEQRMDISRNLSTLTTASLLQAAAVSTAHCFSRHRWGCLLFLTHQHHLTPPVCTPHHSAPSCETPLWFLPLIFTPATPNISVPPAPWAHRCSLFCAPLGMCCAAQLCAERLILSMRCRTQPGSSASRLRAFNQLLTQGLSAEAWFLQKVSVREFSKSFLAVPGLLQAALPLHIGQLCHNRAVPNSIYSSS